MKRDYQTHKISVSTSYVQEGEKKKKKKKINTCLDYIVSSMQIESKYENRIKGIGDWQMA